MYKPSVDRALAFNCPDCRAGIGQLCISQLGQPMAYYVHSSRYPWEETSEFAKWRLGIWLTAHADIFKETNDDTPE